MSHPNLGIMPHRGTKSAGQSGADSDILNVLTGECHMLHYYQYPSYTRTSIELHLELLRIEHILNCI